MEAFSSPSEKVDAIFSHRRMILLCNVWGPVHTACKFDLLLKSDLKARASTLAFIKDRIRLCALQSMIWIGYQGNNASFGVCARDTVYQHGSANTEACALRQWTWFLLVISSHSSESGLGLKSLV